MPMAVVIIPVMPVIPIRVIIVRVIMIVTRIVAVIRFIVSRTKSESYMHSSLGLIWHPGRQTERNERQ